MKPTVVILAAGASERLGECKALVDLDGESPLARLIRQASLASADEIRVVAGAHRSAIELELERIRAEGRVRVLHNANWASGRTGSVALAARELPGRALLLAPVDVPLVQREVFEALFQAWELAGAPPRGWLAPCVEPGPRYGHPLVIGAELAREIQRMAPDQPLREARAGADPVWAIAVRDSAILDDLDAPDDLAGLRLRLKRARERAP